MKCERGLDANAVALEILSDDYTKVAVLQTDRNIELHAQYGKHFKIRVPKYGRAMTYLKPTSDLITVGASNEIYRLNLNEGRFMAPLESLCPELTCVDYNEQYHMIAVGGIDGVAEFWDMNSRERAIELPIKDHEAFSNWTMEEISAVKFSEDGINVAIGTEKGKVRMFDIRYPIPMYELQHQYRKPINKLTFHAGSKKLFSSDSKVIKIFEQDTGKLYTNIQTKSQINDFEIIHGTGFIMCALEEA